ncbi:MAG TPA: S8 family serine peptidase, partial [Anaerolineales bacterium]|nr:S8 family serine peptidase [Anaerolineales bacterium]
MLSKREISKTLLFIGFGILIAFVSRSQSSQAQTPQTTPAPDFTHTTEKQATYWNEPLQAGYQVEYGSEVIRVPAENQPVNWIVILKAPSLQARQNADKGLNIASTRRHMQAELARVQGDLRRQNAIGRIRKEFTTLVNGFATLATPAQVEQIKHHPNILDVYPDYQLSIALDTSVPLIGTPSLWGMVDGSGNPVNGNGIRVAVIDTGIEYTHSAFGSCTALNSGGSCRVVDGYDFANNDTDPIDDNKHGTHVAGTIAGADTEITGVAPQALLYAYKVCTQYGACDTSAIIAGLERAADPNNDGNTSDHVDVANLSLGGPGDNTSPLSIAVDEAVTAGISVVVAAGNSGSNYSTIGAPGASAQAITVGATDDADGITYFSSRGPVQGSVIKPDIVAPGFNIRASVLNGGYAELSGTSMATPHVAGIVALLRQLHPAWTPNQIKAILMNNALDLGANPFAQGAGRIQASPAANPDFLANPGSLSMGVVNNSQPIWTNTRSFIIQNLSNTAQLINLSVAPGLPAGLTTTLSQTSIFIQPNAFAIVLFTVRVDNAVLPFPSSDPLSYSGNILISNGSQSKHIPFALIKAAVMTINWDIPPDVVLIHDRSAWGKYVFLGSPTSPYYAALPPNTYDIISWYFDINGWIVNENINLTNSVAYNIYKADANHTFQTHLLKHDGSLIPASGLSRKIVINHNASGRGMSNLTFGGGGEIPLDALLSDMSNNYRYETSARHYHDPNTIYNSLFYANGVSGALDLTNDYSQATRLEVRYNTLAGTNLRGVLYTGRYGNAMEGMDGFNLLPSQSTQVYYFTPFDSLAFFNSRQIYLGNPDMNAFYAYSNIFRINATGSYTLWLLNHQPGLGDSYIDYTYTDNTYVVNGGPHYWASYLENSNNTFLLRPNYPYLFNNQFYYVRGQWQDQINTIPTYQLTNANGVILRTGDLSAAELLQVPIIAGVHHFTANYSGVLSGNATSGQVELQFDTTLADKNPPVLQEIQILQGNVRKEKVTDGAGKIAVRVADGLPNLTMQIEIDTGTGWQGLVVTQSGDFFSADVPAFSPTVDTFVNLRLTATDSLGNRIANTLSPGFIVLAVPIATPTSTASPTVTSTALPSHTATA